MLYRIIFRGNIVKGSDIASVKKNLAALFNVSDERIEHLFSGRPVTIKKNVDYETAQNYKTALEKAGALCMIESPSDETDGETPVKSVERQEKSQPHAVKQPEQAPQSPLTLPQGITVISPERTPGNLVFSPVRCTTISGSENALNLNRPEMHDIPFDMIRLVSVFAEEESDIMVYCFVLFLSDFPRPFVCDCDKILYKDFPGVIQETVKKSLRNFLLYLCNKYPDMIIDTHTHDYITGTKDIQETMNSLNFVTSLGRALESQAFPET